MTHSSLPLMSLHQDSPCPPSCDHQHPGPDQHRAILFSLGLSTVSVQETTTSLVDDFDDPSEPHLPVFMPQYSPFPDIWAGPMNGFKQENVALPMLVLTLRRPGNSHFLALGEEA